MNRILFALLAAGVLAGCQPSAPATGEAQFVFVRIPEQLLPLAREAKYGNPLDAALQKAGVGEVSGGGSQLSAPDAAGRKSIRWIGLDVDLTDFDQGMPLLKRELLRLGAPAATVLEYERGGKKVEEPLAAGVPGPRR